jgi:hypothetical protein
LSLSFSTVPLADLFTDRWKALNNPSVAEHELFIFERFLKLFQCKLFEWIFVKEAFIGLLLLCFVNFFFCEKFYQVAGAYEFLGF